MYIDLVIFIILLVLVIMFFKILTFIKNNIPLPDVSALIDKYIPSGIFGIIDKYSSGLIQTILNWAYVIIMTIFLSYICKIFFKKKKI